MSEIYILVAPNEDGETASLYTRKELETYLTDEREYDEPHNFLSEWPTDEHGVQYWSERDVLIIKGKIIVPKPIKVVEEYEFD